MLSPSDHSVRYGRIGASEAPGLLGLSPYVSAEQAIAKWLERHAPDWKESTFPAPDRGHCYEGVIFDKYVERTLSKELSGSIVGELVATQVHPVHDWLCATPDRLIRVNGVADRLVQVKYTDSLETRKDWKAGMPDYVACQEIIELAVAFAVWGLPRVDVVVDLGGKTWLGTSVYPLHRNEALERETIGKLETIYRERLEPALAQIKEKAHV